MIEILTLLSSVGTMVFDMIQSAKQVDEKRKESISKFLSDIADTIDEAADELSNDRIPHGACQMIQEFAINLPNVLSGVSTRQKLMNLSDEMYRAYNIESLHLLKQSDEMKIDELYKIAGKFRAAAIMVCMV